MGQAQSASVVANLENSLKRINTVVVNMKSNADQFFHSMESGTSRLDSMGGSNKNTSTSKNLVAPSPNFPSAPAIYSNGPATPAGPGTPGGGGNGGNNEGGGLFSKGAVSAIATGAGLIGSALPGTSQAVEYQLMTQRASFYGIGAGGTGYNNVTSLQNQLSKAGTITDPTQTAQLILNAQASGLGGPNFNQQLKGLENLSNYTPGISASQLAGVGAAMQAPRTVNLMMGMGIQVRNPQTGAMTPPDQVVDMIWKKINAQKLGSASLSESDIRISLEPGNSLDVMLSNLYGSDPVTRQVIVDGLLAKARSGGGALNKENAISTGATTKATIAISNKAAASQTMLGNTAPGQANAFASGTNVLTAIQNFANASSALTGVIGALANVQGFATGVTQGGLGGLISKGFGFIKGLLADGGPAEGGAPYIVGERGPELFVPKTDGVVIPNHMIGNPHRADGGPVVSQASWAQRLLAALGAPANDNNLANVTMWERMEGGNWGNTAKYNPLNTSYQLPGSTNYNSHKPGGGVQAYTSWDQGLQATVGTLTGSNASGRGYTNIVSLLKAGTATKDDFLKALQGSSWDAGRYGGGSSSSVGAGSDKPSSGSTDTPTTKTLAELLHQTNQNSLSNTIKSSGQATVNYGGVSINISGSGVDANTLAQTIAKVLKDQSTLSKAANS